MGELRGQWYIPPCSPARAQSSVPGPVKNGGRVRKIDKELESSGIRLARTLTNLTAAIHSWQGGHVCHFGGWQVLFSAHKLRAGLKFCRTLSLDPFFSW